MFQQLDEGLEALLRSELRLDKPDLDIAFDAPNDTWGASITKPTLNLFLWDIRRSTDKHQAGRQLIERNGVRQWRMRPPRVELRYLLTAWTSRVRDEHELLGRSLAAILANPKLPEEHTNGLSVGGEPVVIQVAKTTQELSDVWSALSGKLRPALDLTITIAVDPAAGTEAGPDTEEFATKVVDKNEDARISYVRRVAGRVTTLGAVGAMVRSPRGVTTVDDAGYFLISAEPGDEIVVELDEPLVGVAPQEGSLTLP